MKDWKYSSVLVTGGTGFLGKAIVAELRAMGVPKIIALSSADADLRDRKETHQIIAKNQPQCVIHAAVQGGGIAWMKEHPVESGLDNVRMNTNVLEAAFQNGASSFVGVSSACAYPKAGKIPYCEEEIWEGYPEPSNGSYALSKRIMMDLGRAYAKQYNFHTVFPVLANLYGPGDHTEPSRAHVVADLMIRCSKKPQKLIVWGTGKAKREFVYIKDAAQGVLASLRAPKGSIVNIGSGLEISIVELAHMIVCSHGLKIEIELDKSKPDGQLQKVLNVERAKALLSWSAQTPLQEGLKKTALWYKDQKILF